MKQLLSIAVMLLAVLSINAAETLKETFNTVTNGQSLQGNVQLPSGTWQMGDGMVGNVSSGVASIKFNGNGAYVITPVLDKVAKIGFTYRSGGSNKDITQLLHRRRCNMERY